MRAMVLHSIGTPLRPEERATAAPGPGEIRLAVEACAVCRTDLHVVDGELPHPKLPLVPGHEIVGRVDAIGEGVDGFEIGQRAGVPWLAHTCGYCPYCLSGRENLCDFPRFTGYTRDGGFATHVVAEAPYAFELSGFDDPVAAAPLMCAGLIGWRSLVAAGDARTIGIYGFGAAAHIIAQVCHWQGSKVFAFTRNGDAAAQAFACSVGADWAGGSDEAPPVPLDAAIIFAPVGALVPAALEHVKKGGRVVCGGIHMTDIPRFPYRLLWEERQIVSIANLTRKNAEDFLAVRAASRRQDDNRFLSAFRCERRARRPTRWPLARGSGACAVTRQPNLTATPVRLTLGAAKCWFSAQTTRTGQGWNRRFSKA